MIALMIIDPQIDFADPKGALSVPGGDVAMTNVANLIKKMGSKISQINVTVDSHHEFDIAHPAYWVGNDGKHPNPFTVISNDDVVSGKWRPALPQLLSDPMTDPRLYTKKLEESGNYKLVIWPPHCIIGSVGHAIFPAVSDAIREWERENIAKTGNFINFITKGTDFRTEHYGALKAEVPYDNAPDTQLNIEVIDMLSNDNIDLILIAGLATDYCVKTTVTQIADEFGDENIKKLVFLQDCAAGLDANVSQAFVTDMVARGMRVAQSTDDLIALI